MKMRGENDFRVKGENIGQPEVIFRKMIFSVTAKHAEKGENDFLKSFSPKTNAPSERDSGEMLIWDGFEMSI